MAEEDLNLNGLILQPKVITTLLTTSQSSSLGNEARGHREKRALGLLRVSNQGTPSSWPG